MGINKLTRDSECTLSLISRQPSRGDLLGTFSSLNDFSFNVSMVMVVNPTIPNLGFRMVKLFTGFSCREPTNRES